MVVLESISDHVVVDTTTQRKTRSCVLAGVSLESSSVAIESGNSPEVGKALRRELKAHFDIPVRYLFLTHTHTDHRNGREAFNDCKLLASQKCLDNMPGSVKLSKWSIDAFDEKYVLKEGDLSLEFHHVGGHSVGHSIAYFPNEKVLFGGDLFIVGSVNFGLPVMVFYQNKPRKTGNPEAYLRAYRTFKSMDIDVIVPGHGDLVHNSHEYLEEQITFFEALKTFIIEAIQEGRRPEEIELPRLGPIEQAYARAERSSPRSKHLRFLENYLLLLKTSFYNYYSSPAALNMSGE